MLNFSDEMKPDLLESQGFNFDSLKKSDFPYTGDVNYGDHLRRYVDEWDWNNVPDRHGKKCVKLNIRFDALVVGSETNMSPQKMSHIIQHRMVVRISAHDIAMCNETTDTIKVAIEDYFPNTSITKMSLEQMRTGISSCIYDHLEEIYDVVDRAEVFSEEHKQFRY